MSVPVPPILLSSATYSSINILITSNLPSAIYDYEQYQQPPNNVPAIPATSTPSTSNPSPISSQLIVLPPAFPPLVIHHQHPRYQQSITSIIYSFPNHGCIIISFSKRNHIFLMLILKKRVNNSYY